MPMNSNPPEGAPMSTANDPTPISYTIRVPPVRVSAAGLTDVGLTRDNNEDAFLLRDLRGSRFLEDLDMSFKIRSEDEEPALLLAVSDGMGGQQAGEVASATALMTLDEKMLEATRSDGFWAMDETRHWLEKAVQEANLRVLAKSREDASTKGMGATLSAMVILGDRVSIAHVGDSRVYLVRSGRLRQLTMDHTHVQDLVSRGHLSVEQARVHQERNLLIQAIGIVESIVVDLTELAAASGDTIMLCSDGVHDFVTDGQIGEVLRSDGSPNQRCAQLIEAAKHGGGSDNITAVVAQFE